MCTGQDAKAHHGNVFLQCDGRDVLDAPADAGVDDLETGVAQRARDDLGAAVVAVEARFGDQDAGGLRLGGSRSAIRTPPAAGTRPTPL